MAERQIVVPDDFPPAYHSADEENLRQLAPHGAVTVHTTRFADRAEFFSRIASAEVVINVRSYSVFDEEAFARAPNLKMVSILGTGTDNVDLEAATRHGVVVTNTPGVGAPSVAELTIGLLLAVSRSIPLSHERLRAGTWQHIEGPELMGKTLALLGIGAIGSRVARIGQGLGMRVIAWTFNNDPARAAELGVELVDREEIFRQADVLSLHLRNSPQARNFVGARELALMKPSAILINTARGEIVDLQALREALESGEIAGAGLDVTEPEPLPVADPLLGAPNLTVLPHIGSASVTARAAMADLAVGNLMAFFDGRPMPHSVALE
jgi:phosphoglycerate dehydrogenase-like enzyme